jgi:FkbM family methyltransferase
MFPKKILSAVRHPKKAMQILGRRFGNLLVFRSILRRDHITFLRRGNIYVNKTDHRGQALLTCGAPLYPGPALAWAEIARRLRPTVCLDIGANYGEVGLSITYGTDTQLFLCEPNPRILPYLNRSVETHFNRTQINVVPAVISDRNHKVRFKINKRWSGASSAAAEELKTGGDNEVWEDSILPGTSVDALLANKGDDLKNCRLLFKVDVEGSEPLALRGMMKTLATVETFAGIIEFDMSMLERAGTDPACFFGKLQSLGRLWEVYEGRVRSASFHNLHPHTDLILAAPNAFDSFALPRYAGLMYLAVPTSTANLPRGFDGNASKLAESATQGRL